MPEALSYLCGPIIRDRVINNEVFKEQYAFLRKSDNLSQDFICHYRLLQLKKLLSWAYQYVPYYTKLFRRHDFNPSFFKNANQLKELPLLTRALIHQNYNDLISTKTVKGSYYTAYTGGTSGRPVKLLMDYNSIFKEIAFIYNVRRRLDYQLYDRIATFRGLEYGRRWYKYSPMYNELCFSPPKLSAVTVQDYIDKINDYKPRYLNGYPSSIYFLARLMKERGLKLNFDLKGIFLISENARISQRQYIEQFFQTRTLAFYGQTERVVFGEEDKINCYRFNPFYGYTEIITGNEGSEIVGTGFLNYNMPLIRYKTNDICQKIKGNKLLNITTGWQLEDYLVGKNGEQITEAALNFHSDVFAKTIHQQYIQKHRGKMIIYLVPARDFSSGDIVHIRKSVLKKVGHTLDFRIKVGSRPILTKGGKYKTILNNEV